jgi:hypothetical protein
MTTNYSEWQRQFKGQVKVVVKEDTKVIQEACQLLYKRIVERTPVGNPALWKKGYAPPGYSPGALKANWKLEKHGEDYIIYNDLPYAYRVETGWSTQAPYGMMRVSVLEFNSILEEVARRYKK